MGVVVPLKFPSLSHSSLPSRFAIHGLRSIADYAKPPLISLHMAVSSQLFNINSVDPLEVVVRGSETQLLVVFKVAL